MQNISRLARFHLSRPHFKAANGSPMLPTGRLPKLNSRLAPVARRFCSKNSKPSTNTANATKEGAEATNKATEAIVEQAGSSNTNWAGILAPAAIVAAIIAYYQFSEASDSASNASSGGGIDARVKALEQDVSKMIVSSKNKAFVFIKPHAVTDKVEKLVLDEFGKRGIKVTKTGVIEAETIDKNLLVDTHYGAIASKAVKLQPNELILSDKAKKDFEKMSGMSWENALQQNLVKNAMTYSNEKGVNGEELDQMWSKLKRGTNLIKFGGGFYCGQLKDPKTGSVEYVINGFYMQMRSKFTAPGCRIKFFLVEFDPSQLSWEEFRNDVLGVTDPSTAVKGSLRRAVYDNWKALGLQTKPNTGDNGVHASASPFEAFAERCNWLKDEYSIESDVFGKALLAHDVNKEMIAEFMGDCSVKYEGKKQSIFDLLEDMNSEDCLEKVLEIAKQQ